MRLAVMQPYLFPYLGYFQLAAACDLFVVLDDVTYIKQGWINRNRIQSSTGSALFSVPLSQASSHTLIKDTFVDARRYSRWRGKFLKTLHQTYAKAPNFEPVFRMVEGVVDEPAHDLRIAAVAVRSISYVMQYLGMPFRCELASQSHPNIAGLKGIDRVLAICAETGATSYINAPGGRGLYEREPFASAGMGLQFVRPDIGSYAEVAEVADVEGRPLSVIHTLMYADRATVRSVLESTQVDDAL
jgi:hypothetical protein